VTPQDARCARHPEAGAVDTCQRCGAFVCGECTQIRDEDVFCPGCLPFLDRPPSRRPMHALRCAVAGPVLFGLGVLTGRYTGPASVLLTRVAPVAALAAAGGFLLREALGRARGEVAHAGAVYAVAWVLTGLEVLVVAAAVYAVLRSGFAS
jgi:hypothetical protein